jgi:hypothetical protein
VISRSFAFRATRCLNFSYKSILPGTAFPSTLVNMLELSPPLPVFLLLRVGGLSRLNTRVILSRDHGTRWRWPASRNSDPSVVQPVASRSTDCAVPSPPYTHGFGFLFRILFLPNWHRLENMYGVSKKRFYFRDIPGT